MVMEEKIIEARITKNRLSIWLLCIGVGLIAIGFFTALDMYHTKTGYPAYAGIVWNAPYSYWYDDFGEFFLSFMTERAPWSVSAFFPMVIDIGLIVFLFSLFYVWKMSKCSLIVTTRRVTGKSSFGKAVDLPLNQISSVALGSFSKITVATSSGRMHFWFIKNRDEVHTALTDAIGKTQIDSSCTQNNSVIPSNADELKKYKELLDSGVITQEEFDAKKKQLLGM